MKNVNVIVDKAQPKQHKIFVLMFEENCVLFIKFSGNTLLDKHTHPHTEKHKKRTFYEHFDHFFQAKYTQIGVKTEIERES